MKVIFIVKFVLSLKLIMIVKNIINMGIKKSMITAVIMKMRQLTKIEGFRMCFNGSLVPIIIYINNVIEKIKYRIRKIIKVNILSWYLNKIENILNLHVEIDY